MHSAHFRPHVTRLVSAPLDIDARAASVVNRNQRKDLPEGRFLSFYIAAVRFL